VSEPLPTEQPPPSPPTPAIEPPRPHAVRIVNNDDLRRSRLTVLFRILLVLPHLIWLTLYSTAAIVVAIVNWFATLFEGRTPDRIHRWLVRYLRYSVYVNSYLFILANPYPPFHGTEGSYPIDLEVDGPDTQHRLVTAFRLILAIPALVLNWVFNQVLQIVGLLGWLVLDLLRRVRAGVPLEQEEPDVPAAARPQ